MLTLQELKQIVDVPYPDPWANDQDWALYYYLKEGKNYD